MSKRKQTSLFNYDFTKKISHGGKLANVVPGNEGNKTNFVCGICGKNLKTSQPLGMQTTWCKSKAETNLVSNNNTRIAFNQTINEIKKEKNDEKIVKSVIEKPVVDVEASELAQIPDKRKSYTLKEKVDALNDLNDGMIPRDVGFKYKVHKSMKTRWKAKEKEIYGRYVESKKADFFRKCRRNDKHKAMFSRLYDKFCEARKKDLQLNFDWLYVRANQIHLEQRPNVERLPNSTSVYFLRRYKIRLLCVQRKRQVHAKKNTPAQMKWHSNLREKLIKSGCSKSTYDKN